MVDHRNKMMWRDGDKIHVSECVLKVYNLGGTKHELFYFIYYFSHLVSVTDNRYQMTPHPTHVLP